MANEKVSQLNELTAAEISSTDIFLVGDTSAIESKKMSAAQLLLFVESSGSFAAYTSIQANTASYILGSGVDGAVATASYVEQSISSSYSSYSENSTLASTASYFNTSSISIVPTASHLRYTGVPNGTASYAVVSNTTFNSSQSAFLVYSGGNNGTASYAITASHVSSASYARSSSMSTSASYASQSFQSTTSSYAQSSSIASTSSYALSFNNPIKAWSMVTWSYGASATQPSLYLQNNIDSFQYISNTVKTDTTFFHYGVTFTTPLNNTNYILMGDAYAPYRGTENYQPSARQGIVFHPVYSNRTTSSCTMSLAIDTTLISTATWFSSVSSSYPNGQNTYLTFQIIGS